MSVKKSGPVNLLLILSFALLSACGGKSSRLSSAGDQDTSTPTTLPPFITLPTITTSTLAGIPASKFTFAITGEDGTNPQFITPTILTDSVLNVKVTAGAGQKISLPGGLYSNQQFKYGCVEYEVKVNEVTHRTGILGVEGENWLCPEAKKTSEPLDFSEALGEGHTSVQVSVKAYAYDLYCMGCLTNSNYNGWYAGCAYACPMHVVHKAHVVGGYLQVQTNGTSFRN